MRVNRNRAAGFTLVETLAAFSILALSMVVLFGGLANASRREAGSQTREELLRHARNELEVIGVGIPIRTGVTRGKWPDGDDWSVTAMPYAPTGSASAGRPLAYWVEVVVTRRSAGPGAAICLRTVKFEE